MESLGSLGSLDGMAERSIFTGSSARRRVHSNITSIFTSVFAGYALRFPCAGIGRAPVFGENAVRKFLLQNKKQRNPIVTSYSARIPLKVVETRKFNAVDACLI